MNHTDTRLSVVVPVYMGDVFLWELYRRVRVSAGALFSDFELILVNDASPDGSWEVIRDLCAEDARVKGVNLSRNFGQHCAITAGLACATGGWVVVMDCDLQDCPEEIPALYRKALEGFDSVFAQRTLRQDTRFKRLQSWMFYRVFGYLTDTKMDASVANFGIYNRKVVDAILSLGDRIRYFPTMSQWVGFRRTCLPVSHAARERGTSSYSLGRLLKLAADTMVAFSDKPLRICIRLGFLMAALSVVIALWYLFLRLTGQIRVLGYSSLILSLWFIGGMLLSSIGIVGLYVGKIFDQVKQRPIYLVTDRINL